MRRILALLAFSAAAAIAQTPTIASVVNSESFGTQLCPGLIATVYGTNFGTSAASVSVSVGGTPAYVFPSIVATQINVEIPFGISAGPTTLTVSVGGVQSAPFNITISAVAPYFATQGGAGSGLADVLDASVLVTGAAPAHAGDLVVAYAVGLGPTNPATPTGVATASASIPTLPTVTVGGVAAKVSFAGIANGFAGLYQVNFTIPPSVSGTVPLVMMLDGVSSSTVAASTDTAVTIAVVSTSSAPAVTAVQNAASFGTTLCPGLQAIVYGSGFGATAANVSFTVGGKTGYVIPPISPNQLLVQLPFEAATGPTTMTVTVAGVASAPLNITLSAVSPAFLLQAPPTGAPALPAGAGLADVLENSTNTAVTPTAPAHDGDSLYAYAVGLGATNPPTATGPVTVGNPTATVPTVTVGGVAAKGVSAGTTQYVGVYQVNFTVPPNVQGTQPLVITIGGASSSTMVTLATPGITYVENNATNSTLAQTPISPGSIATVFANSLGVATNDVSIFPATTDKGVQVTFNGIAAPLFHVIGSPGAGSSQQIDLLVPTNLPTSGTANVQLTTSTAFYGNVPVNMVPANPGFYRIADSKATPPLVNVIAQFANTAWLALPVSTTANVGLPACTPTTNVLSECGQPATPGDILVLYATGLGLATPNGDPNGTPLPTGQIPPPGVLYETPTMPVVTIGGIPATVLFSGLTQFPGEYQINITVPSGIASGDNVPVVLSILGGTDSSTTISIQPRPSS